MTRRDLDRRRRRETFTLIVRALRQRRGLSSRQAADRMGLTLRSYERFEKGDGTLDLDRIYLFAEVTDCDHQALFAALELDQPDVALLCADNKLMLIHAQAFEAFCRDVGEDVRRLEAAVLIEAFTRTYDQLASEQKERADRARLWLERRPKIGRD